MTQELPKAKYLGDAVYVTVASTEDLVLTTDSHIISEARNVIFLPPEVALELLDYLQRWKGAIS